ncbi:hypothetical protein MNBD_GAMMA13-895 [hydrothermal vent metagenome]|uniref:Uncharacterized protein n=1 Tax=hydrothermal vent metagenome TaxID=652676 RepID=A0A3B0YRH6_9ZZZZ
MRMIAICHRPLFSSKALRGMRDFVRERQCPLGIIINNAERVTQYEENLIGILFTCL